MKKAQRSKHIFLSISGKMSMEVIAPKKKTLFQDYPFCRLFLAFVDDLFIFSCLFSRYVSTRDCSHNKACNSVLKRTFNFSQFKFLLGVHLYTRLFGIVESYSTVDKVNFHC